jgi:hypothetical protein
MKKSLIPKSFKAGHRTFRITTRKKDVVGLKAEGPDIETLRGCTYLHAEIIWVDPQWSEAHVRECVLHELMHVAAHISGAGNILESEFDQDSDHEERYITVVSMNLYTILMDNPHLVDFLFGPRANADSG